MSVSDFLDGITIEGEDSDPFDIGQEQENDVPATEEKSEEKESEDKSEEKSEDESEEKEAPASEGDKSEESDDESDTDEKHKFPPLHEHPRFQKVYKEKKEKDREIEELRKEIEEIKSQSQSNKQSTEISTEVPPFAQQMGYTPESWALFQQQEAERETSLKNSLKEELKKELEAEKEMSTKQKLEDQQKTDEFYEFEKGRIQKEFELNDSDINSVMKYAVKHQPTDSHGAIDIEKAYYKWALENKKTDNTIDKKKKVAAMMNPSDSTSDAPSSGIQSAESLRNTDWYDLVGDND